MADIYAEIRLFTAKLNRAEFKDWASKLTDAVEGGSTGSEILMAVRWNIRELLRSEKLPNDIKNDAEILLKLIKSTGV